MPDDGGEGPLGECRNMAEGVELSQPAGIFVSEIRVMPMQGFKPRAKAEGGVSPVNSFDSTTIQKFCGNETAEGHRCADLLALEGEIK